MNRHHLNPHHQALVSVVAMKHHSLLAVLLVEQVASNQHLSPAAVDMVLMLALLLVELSV
jgi:hypothetical protein